MGNNTLAYDLVKDWLDGETDVCRNMFEALVEVTDELEVHRVKDGESLTLQLSAKEPTLEVASFMFVLSQQGNQEGLLKQLCKNLHS